MSLTDKLKRGLAVGAVAAVGTQIIYGSGGTAVVWGQEIPGAIAVGGAAMTGSVAADYVHENLPGMGLGEIGAGVVEYGVAGLVTAGAADYLGVSNGINMEAAALGAFSLLGGRYAYAYMNGGGILI